MLKTPENEGSEAPKSTKTPILCSGKEELASGSIIAETLTQIGIRKGKLGLPANHRAHFQNFYTLITLETYLTFIIFINIIVSVSAITYSQLLPGIGSTRAQNRGFCALFAFRTPVFGLSEHKIEVFVRFYPSELPFSGFSSTKWFFGKFRAVKLSKFGRF